MERARDDAAGKVGYTSEATAEDVLPSVKKLSGHAAEVATAARLSAGSIAEQRTRAITNRATGALVPCWPFSDSVTSADSEPTLHSLAHELRDMKYLLQQVLLRLPALPGVVHDINAKLDLLRAGVTPDGAQPLVVDTKVPIENSFSACGGSSFRFSQTDGIHVRIPYHNFGDFTYTWKSEFPAVVRTILRLANTEFALVCDNGDVCGVNVIIGRDKSSCGVEMIW